MITLDIKEFKDNIKSLEDVSVRKHTGGIQYLYDTIYSAIINGKYASGTARKRSLHGTARRDGLPGACRHKGW